MNSIFEKELELADAVFEASMSNLVNVSEIEDTYMIESAGEAVKDFFSKLIKLFKDFFDKIEEVIQEKLVEKKFKDAINKIKKTAIRNNKKVAVSGYVNEDTLTKLCNNVIKEASNATKKITNAKSTDDVNKIYDDYNMVINKFYNEIEIKKINNELTVDECGKIILNKNILMIQDNTITALDNLADCIGRNYDIKDQEEKDAGIRALKEDKKSKIKAIATSIANFNKKIGNLIVNNKKKVIIGVSVLAAGIGGIEAGKKIKENKTTTESVDDILDDMMSEIEI